MKFNGITFLFLALPLVLFLICCSEKTMDAQLTIVEERVMDNIPSGSGLVIKEGVAHIISDDGTGIYQLNLLNHQHNKIPITGFAYDIYREEKAVKRDFEAAALAQWNGSEYLLAIGSGSKESSRDSMLMLNLSNFADQKILSLANIYRQLQLLTRTEANQWNIEGATTIGDDLFLLNRGNNMVIRINQNDFLAYALDSTTEFPSMRFNRVKLPSIGRHEARLSGACTLDSSHILFSASVEDTPDWISDGPVLGSFIGVYSVQTHKVVSSFMLKNKAGEARTEKLEAVDIIRKEPNGDIILLAISDNDNGTSRLLHIRLSK